MPTNVKELPWFDEYGWVQKEIPQPAVEACYHSGQCQGDVEHWRKVLNFTVPRQKAIDYLEGYGAWEVEEMNAWSEEELAEKVLWIACGDISEQGEWLGIVH